MPLTGVITFHHVPNFGAFVQAWSLVQAIQKCGHLVEVVDYRPTAHMEKFRRKGLKSWRPSLGRWRMKRFMHQNLPLSPTVRTPAEVDALVRDGRYDTLVCGSDQVWLIDGVLPFDRTYFLGVGEGQPLRRISYAPSCGNIDSFGDDAKEVGRLLRDLDHVSVRDENAMRLVTQLGISDAQQVVDPSLIADLDPLVGPNPHHRKYIAVVGGMNPAAGRLVEAISTRRQLDVVAVGTRCSAAHCEKRFINPGEWVNWIAHAEGVVTSLFHGAAVSIALRRPFLAIDAGGRAFKLTDLLGRFNLESHFVSQCDGEYPGDDGWLDLNYSESGEVIQSAVEQSRLFLRKALDG